MPTRRRGDDAATTTTEYALVLAALAALVSFTFATGTGQLVEVVRRAWCRLGAAACDRAGIASGIADPWDDPDPVRRASWGSVAVLGDSFASGEGNGRYGAAGSDERCHAGASAHGVLVARSLDLLPRTTVAACSGARLADLRHRRHHHPPQLDALDAGTSLVTVTMGGNDLDWANEIQACVTAELHPFGDDCREGDARDDALDRRIRALRGGLVAAYEAVRARSPHARIVVTGYPRFFPADPRTSYRQAGVDLLDTETQAWINSETRLLNDTIRAAAAEAGVEYVEAYDAFDGHELTTDRPWYRGVEYRCCASPLEPGTFHPNGDGQQALAAAVEAAVRHPIR